MYQILHLRLEPDDKIYVIDVEVMCEPKYNDSFFVLGYPSFIKPPTFFFLLRIKHDMLLGHIYR